MTNCHALKLIARDGKNRLTDVVDIEGMFRLTESIPSKKAEPEKVVKNRKRKVKSKKRK